jgi:hypothetical protein
MYLAPPPPHHPFALAQLALPPKHKRKTDTGNSKLISFIAGTHFCRIVLHQRNHGILQFMGKRAAARPRTPGLQPGQFAVRVPLPAAVNVPDLIFKRIAANALSDVVMI